MSTSSASRQIKRFHVVVVQWTSKKCTKKRNACAELFFWSLNLYCFWSCRCGCRRSCLSSPSSSTITTSTTMTTARASSQTRSYFGYNAKISWTLNAKISWTQKYLEHLPRSIKMECWWVDRPSLISSYDFSFHDWSPGGDCNLCCLAKNLQISPLLDLGTPLKGKSIKQSIIIVVIHSK